MLTACSSSSSPAIPVVDSFALADTVTVSAQQSYDITGTVSFHDDSEAVTAYTLHFDVPATVVADQHMSIDATNKAKDLPVAFSLPGDIKKGDVVVLITLYGASGASSDSATEHVTVQ